MNDSELNQGSSKITPEHTRRLAYIYVRQSTMQQVEHNRESQANQYRLVDRARALGWSPACIRVIDSDQGKSGKDSSNREGFNELLAEVSLNHVGIIFGYEVSRLARNNSDWYRLLDLAAVFGTLIADSDGLYDPRLYNDRLLLGLNRPCSQNTSSSTFLVSTLVLRGRMGLTTPQSVPPTNVSHMIPGKRSIECGSQAVAIELLSNLGILESAR